MSLTLLFPTRGHIGNYFFKKWDILSVVLDLFYGTEITAGQDYFVVARYE